MGFDLTPLVLIFNKTKIKILFFKNSYYEVRSYATSISFSQK